MLKFEIKIAFTQIRLVLLIDATFLECGCSLAGMSKPGSGEMANHRIFGKFL